jgi:uncharacterized protein (TIRG00374 family)
MMNDTNVISRNFQGWKIGLAIFIGLAVAAWMLIRGFKEVHYIKDEVNGTHQWIDANHDGNVNDNDPNEFQPVLKGGNYKLQSAKDLFNSINWSGATIFWMFLAIVFVVGRDFFYMLRIRLLTHQLLSWKRSFFVIMIWEFASALSPGVISGSAVAMFILNREKIPLGKSTAIVLITAFMDNLFYILLIPLVFLFIDSHELFPSNLGSSGVSAVFWTGYFVFLGIVIFFFSAIFLVPAMANRFFQTLAKIRLFKRWKKGMLQTGQDIELAARVYRKASFLFWFKVFLSTAGSWISRFLVINALLQAFISLGLLQHLLVLGKQLVLWLLMRVSPTPGGSGIAEYAFGELLADLGGSMLLITLLALLWRLISYFPYLFIGAFLLPRWIKQTEKNTKVED